MLPFTVKLPPTVNGCVAMCANTCALVKLVTPVSWLPLPKMYPPLMLPVVVMLAVLLNPIIPVALL